MTRQSVTDQVRNFPLLCHYLSSGTELKSQTAFHLPPDLCIQLVQVYFQIEETIIRELLGTKYKQQNRKGIEILSEKTKKPIHAVKRVHDNLRAIYQAISKSKGISLVGYLQDEFLITLDLAENYILIIFLCIHKFEVSKKKLINMKFKHFMQISQLMSLHWCGNQPEKFISSLQTLQLNKNFVESLKVLKTAFTKDTIDEYKQIVMVDVPKISMDKASKIDKEFNTLIKNCLSLGVTLSQQKEFKDFFISLPEKIRNPLKERMELNIKEVRGLLRLIIASFAPLNLPSEVKEEVSDYWALYLSTLGECVRVIYNVY